MGTKKLNLKNIYQITYADLERSPCMASSCSCSSSASRWTLLFCDCTRAFSSSDSSSALFSDLTCDCCFSAYKKKIIKFICVYLLFVLFSLFSFIVDSSSVFFKFLLLTTHSSLNLRVIPLGGREEGEREGEEGGRGEERGREKEK